METENQNKCDICSVIPRKYDKSTETADVILEGKLTKVCRRCSEVHDIIPLTNPDLNKLLDPLNGIRMRKEEFKKQQEISEFGKTLRRTRERARMTTAKLAEAIQESEQDIKAVENGNLENKTVVNKMKQFLLTNLRKDEKTALEAVKQTKFINTKETTVNDLMKMGGIQQVQKVQEVPAPVQESKKENVFSKFMGYFVKKMINIKSIEACPEKIEDISIMSHLVKNILSDEACPQKEENIDNARGDSAKAVMNEESKTRDITSL